LPALPLTPYALAKNSLRLFLEALQSGNPFVLQWIRFFYLYGPGQNPASILAQLDRAIDESASVFNMSGGEQLRDYLAVEDAASCVAAIVEHTKTAGVINCCSGAPISVRRLVERRIEQRKATIQLNLGRLPYRDYESFAFWGSRRRLDAIVNGEASNGAHH